MSLRATLTMTALAVLLALANLPVAAAATSCSNSQGASGSFSLGCGMSGLCPPESVCITYVSCSASFVGVATGSCGGVPMACNPTGCTGTSLPHSQPIGGSWAYACSVSGTTLTTAQLSCTVHFG